MASTTTAGPTIDQLRRSTRSGSKAACRELCGRVHPVSVTALLNQVYGESPHPAVSRFDMIADTYGRWRTPVR